MNRMFARCMEDRVGLVKKPEALHGFPTHERRSASDCSSYKQASEASSSLFWVRGELSTFGGSKNHLIPEHPAVGELEDGALKDPETRKPRVPKA